MKKNRANNSDAPSELIKVIKTLLSQKYKRKRKAQRNVE